MSKYIPADLHAAATRAAIRTGIQALSSFIPVGIVNIAFNVELLHAFVITILTALATATCSAATAYFMIIYRGLPGEYLQDKANDQSNS